LEYRLTKRNIENLADLNEMIDIASRHERVTPTRDTKRIDLMTLSDKIRKAPVFVDTRAKAEDFYI
jgi:hypothetical protein